MPETTLPAWECLRCGHVWPKRGDQRPATCAKCRNVLWDRPRRTPKATEAAR